MNSVVVDRPSPARFVAIDHLRAAIVVLVVVHHAVLAYCRFGHHDPRHYLASTAPIVDADRWLGFDILVLLGDSVLMPLMFLLSGLFVRDSLRRKGPAAYLRDRVVRLGLPFVVAALTLVPLAYYPSFLLSGGEADLSAFWRMSIGVGPWPSGPPWFIAVLLALDVAMVAADGVGAERLSLRVPASVPSGVALLWGLSLAAYLPLLAAFGAARWLTLGPLAVQASRIGLYVLYFLAGVSLGRHGASRGVLARDGPLRRHWLGCGLAAAGAAALLIATAAARLLDPSHLAPALAMGPVLLAFCAVASAACLATFLRFGGGRTPASDSLTANAYGIFLLHYPVVTWVQYALLDVRLTALAKALIVLAVALPVSWTGASLLRRLPGLRRAL